MAIKLNYNTEQRSGGGITGFNSRGGITLTNFDTSSIKQRRKQDKWNELEEDKQKSIREAEEAKKKQKNVSLNVLSFLQNIPKNSAGIVNWVGKGARSYGRDKRKVFDSAEGSWERKTDTVIGSVGNDALNIVSGAKSNIEFVAGKKNVAKEYTSKIAEADQIRSEAWKIQDKDERKQLLDQADSLLKPYEEDIKYQYTKAEMAKTAGLVALDAAPFLPLGKISALNKIAPMGLGDDLLRNAPKWTQAVKTGVKYAVGVDEIGMVASTGLKKGFGEMFQTSLVRGSLSGSTQGMVDSLSVFDMEDVSAGDKAKLVAQNVALNAVVGTLFDVGIGTVASVGGRTQKMMNEVESKKYINNFKNNNPSSLEVGNLAFDSTSLQKATEARYIVNEFAKMEGREVLGETVGLSKQAPEIYNYAKQSFLDPVIEKSQKGEPVSLVEVQSSIQKMKEFLATEDIQTMSVSVIDPQTRARLDDLKLKIVNGEDITPQDMRIHDNVPIETNRNGVDLKFDDLEGKRVRYTTADGVEVKGTIQENMLKLDSGRDIELTPEVKDRILNNFDIEGVNTGAKFQVDESQNTKQQQLDKINRLNPMTDDIHTGIRTVDDIKTYQEAFDDPESFVYPDYSKADAQKAIDSGKIIIYSSKPLNEYNAQFVTPSKMQAKDYAGNGKVYSKEVNLDEVAWINGDEGQLVGKIEVDERADQLIEEARKYKSAKEFVKSQENVFGEKLYLANKEAKKIRDEVNKLKEELFETDPKYAQDPFSGEWFKDVDEFDEYVNESFIFLDDGSVEDIYSGDKYSAEEWAEEWEKPIEKSMDEVSKMHEKIKAGSDYRQLADNIYELKDEIIKKTGSEPVAVHRFSEDDYNVYPMYKIGDFEFHNKVDLDDWIAQTGKEIDINDLPSLKNISSEVKIDKIFKEEDLDFLKNIQIKTKAQLEEIYNQAHNKFQTAASSTRTFHPEDEAFMQEFREYSITESEGADIKMEAIASELAEKYDIKVDKQDNKSLGDAFANILDQEQGKRKEMADTVYKYFDKDEVDVKFVQSITTPKGQKALGVYFDEIITFAQDANNTTPEHEVLHAYFDMFTGVKRKSDVLEQVKKQQGLEGDLEAEEWLADNFVDFVRDTDRSKSLPDQIKTMFVDVWEGIKSLVGNENKVRSLYKDIIAKNRDEVGEMTGNTMFQVQTPETDDFVKQLLGVPKGKTKSVYDNPRLKELQTKAEEFGSKRKSLERKIDESNQEIEAIVSALDNHPGKFLHKYANKKEGTLPELGSTNSIWARKGDDIATELGLKDSDEAQVVYQEWLDMRKTKADLEDEIEIAQTGLQMTDIRNTQTVKEIEDIIKSGDVGEDIQYMRPEMVSDDVANQQMIEVGDMDSLPNKEAVTIKSEISPKNTIEAEGVTSKYFERKRLTEKELVNEAPIYREVVNIEDAEKEAVRIVKASPEYARRVLDGEVEVGDEMLRGKIIQEYANLAKKNNDYVAYNDRMRSISRQATEGGRFVKSFDDGQPFSTNKVFTQVQNSKRKSQSKASAKAKDSLKKSLNVKIDQSKLSSIIDKLTC